MYAKYITSHQRGVHLRPPSPPLPHKKKNPKKSATDKDGDHHISSVSIYSDRGYGTLQQQ